MNTRLAITISAAALSLAFAGACQKREEPSGAGTTGATTGAVDTSRTTAEHPTPMGATTTALASEDKEFMTKAAIGGMLEVRLGQQAAQKGLSADVKAFGNRMVTDHGKANDELKQLASKKGFMLPTELDENHKEKVDELSKLTGAKFDREYAKDMVDDHEEDVKEFKDAAKNAKDPDLRAWAGKTLPILEDHLKMAKDMKAKEQRT
jgi:putative membrane protein